MSERAGHIGQLVRTLAHQLRDAVTGALGIAAHDLPVQRPHRVMVVEKVGRNAVAELVNQARNHPQRGDLGSANPAYVALAELAANVGIGGLALGLKGETGEISFLDLDGRQETAFVDRERNRILWRQLKKLVNILVDRNMLGPRKPIRAPDEIPDEPDPLPDGLDAAAETADALGALGELAETAETLGALGETAETMNTLGESAEASEDGIPEPAAPETESGPDEMGKAPDAVPPGLPETDGGRE